MGYNTDDLYIGSAFKPWAFIRGSTALTTLVHVCINNMYMHVETKGPNSRV